MLLSQLIHLDYQLQNVFTSRISWVAQMSDHKRATN